MSSRAIDSDISESGVSTPVGSETNHSPGVIAQVADSLSNHKHDLIDESSEDLQSADLPETTAKEINDSAENACSDSMSVSGLDGMVINLASLLAGTATNPFGNRYFKGPSEAPLKAASACPGVYGKGAYPGYAGDLLVDSTTGASYNAHGDNGRKYLLPALYDPSTASCSTIV
ncbi:hypothetical protein RYX36_020726 [Vicia faba]